MTKPQENYQHSVTKEQPMSTPLSAPSSSVSSTSTSANGFGRLAVDLIVMASVAALVACAVQYFAPSVFGTKDAAAEPQIVTVNADVLVREQILALGAKVSEGSVPVAEMPERTDKFTAAMLEKLNGYGKEGRVVLRGDSVIAAPDSVPDLTGKLRDELQAQGVMERPVDRKK